MDVKQLERMPLFAGLDKRERARVAQAADEVDVPAGKRLAVEGDLAYEFFVIEDGKATVEVDGETKGELQPDDFFGEIGVLQSEHRRTATVTAETPMKLMVMTGHDFRAISRDLPGVTSKVRAAMAERMG
jgi:CRP-like cAMP-binding protein